MAMTLFTFVLNDVVVPRSQRYAEVSLKRALGRSLASETWTRRHLSPLRQTHWFRW